MPPQTSQKLGLTNTRNVWGRLCRSVWACVGVLAYVVQTYGIGNSQRQIHQVLMYPCMANRFNIDSDLVISRNELEITPIHFLISLNI